LVPFIAKPVRFNANGEAENWSFANIGAQDQGTLGSAPGIEGNNTSRYSLIQNEQTRKNFTVFATFDINDRIKAYSQNIYSTVETVLPRNGASGNAVTSAGSETSGILISINNPYLSATSQQLLRPATLGAVIRRQRPSEPAFPPSLLPSFGASPGPSPSAHLQYYPASTMDPMSMTSPVSSLVSPLPTSRTASPGYTLPTAARLMRWP
jgi:hypothetical protein